MSSKEKIDLRNCLNTHQAAKELRCHEATLRKWRTKGEGPRFIKSVSGRVFYRRDVVEKYKNDRYAEYESTAEAKEDQRKRNLK